MWHSCSLQMFPGETCVLWSCVAVKEHQPVQMHGTLSQDHWLEYKTGWTATLSGRGVPSYYKMPVRFIKVLAEDHE